MALGRGRADEAEDRQGSTGLIGGRQAPRSPSCSNMLISPSRRASACRTRCTTSHCFSPVLAEIKRAAVKAAEVICVGIKGVSMGVELPLGVSPIKMACSLDESSFRVLMETTFTVTLV